MACARGCADCPACRGEVPHDAPVLHDLAWGMMLTRDAPPCDSHWSACQTGNWVRSGIMARARSGLGDANIFEYMARLEARGDGRRSTLRVQQGPTDQPDRSGGAPLSGQFSVAPWWLGLAGGMHWDLLSWLDETLRRLARKLRQEEAAASPTITVVKPARQQFPVPRSGVPKIRSPWAPPANAKCCVVDFQYPIRVGSGRTPAKGGHGLYVKFEGEAEYLDAPGCACHCCEFEQFVVRVTNNYLFPRGGGAQRAAPRYPGSAPTIEEDCLWWLKSNPSEAFRNGPAGGPKDQAPVPRGADGKIPDGVEVMCYGEDGPMAGSRSYSRYVRKDCGYWMCDAPSVEEPGAMWGFESEAVYVGQIVDACHDRHILRRESFSIGMRVGLDEFGRLASEAATITRQNSDGMPFGEPEDLPIGPSVADPCSGPAGIKK